jgi:hypothetical protein
MATVSLRLNKQSKPGERSILVQLYINRELKPEISTGEKTLPEFWNGSRVTSGAKGYKSINANLSRIELELMQLWRDNMNSPADLKAKMIEVVRGKSSTSQKKTIFEALEKYLLHSAAEKSDNTLKMYRSMRDKLVKFDVLYPLDFSTLDFNFYDRFKRFLYGQPNPNYPKGSLFLSDSKDYYLLDVNDNTGLPIGLFDDTVYKYFTNLKAFLNWSEKRGYQIHPSFKTWEVIKKKHPPISLTIDELHRLETTPMPTKAMEIARDYLVIECRTGQRISDIKRFNHTDFKDNKWTFRPKKGNRLSGKTVTVHFFGLSAPALFILSKYNFKLPEVSEQKINENIKKACEEAKINDNVQVDRWIGNKLVRFTGPKHEFCSTHIGRKTFVTLGLANGMPEAYVTELTGIEAQTLKHYRGKFEDSSIEKYLKSVEDNIAIMRKHG